MKQSKIIGILGGMGPLATAYYFNKLVLNHHVSLDQDYPRVIVDNHSQIPDRTQAILKAGADPLPYLIESVELFNHAHVTHAFMPCFTAHHYITTLKEHAAFEFISVFDVLNEYLQSHSHIKKIGIIATTGSQKMKLFENHLLNTTIVYPSDEHQTLIMQAIYNTEHGVKANRVSHITLDWINQAVDSLLAMDVDILIAGCTEIGMVMDQLKHQNKWLDPMMLVIKKLIQQKGS